MSLKKKAAQIDLGMLVAGAVANSGQSANPLNQAPAASGMTAVGMHAETVYKDRKISAENESLKAELAGWAGATLRPGCSILYASGGRRLGWTCPENVESTN